MNNFSFLKSKLILFLPTCFLSFIDFGLLHYTFFSQMLSKRSANGILSLKRKYNTPVWFGILGFLILVFGIFLWKSFPSGSFKGVSAHLNCFMLILELTHKQKSSPSSWDSQKWIEFAHNPVLPDAEHSDKTGTVFDLGLWQENMTITGIPADIYYRDHDDHIETNLTWRMWNSWRPSRSIGYSTSVDGKDWVQDIQIALGPSTELSWEEKVNRPFVKKIARGKYAMWYTGQDKGNVGAKIGYAESADGIEFKRMQGM
jgi:hypothetical protein